jgi:hypothetical protein
MSELTLKIKQKSVPFSAKRKHIDLDHSLLTYQQSAAMVA